MAEQDLPDNQGSPEDAAPAPEGAGQDAGAPDAGAEAGAAAEDAIGKAQDAVRQLGEDAGAGSTPPGVAEQAEEALAAAQEVAGEASSASAGASQRNADTPSPADMPNFTAPARNGAHREIDLLADVNLNVKIELGRTRMVVEDVLRLGEGSVVELDKLAGDPVDIYVNERHVARGEVLVVNDNFCVRISEILSRGATARD